MSNLADHSSGDFVKLLFVGNSGSGKTGALVSLVKAGYKLRIIDMDNGLDAMVNFIRAECPDQIGNVQYETLRDKYKAGPTGSKVSGSPKAYIRANNLLDKWTDDTKPEEWGSDTILVIDSLTHFGRAAFAWARGLNPNSRDPRQWYKVAQDSIMDILDTVTGNIFQTNVIVITHIDYRENANGFRKGFASSVGKAIGDKIPSFFNTMLLAESMVMGKTSKRTIKTIATTELDLKNPAPMKIDATYPLETGMADIFEKLKGN